MIRLRSLGAVRRTSQDDETVTTQNNERAASTPATAPTAEEPVDFIRTIVADHTRRGVYHKRVATRFPPEPNGYLHIGHAKSICLNFGVAQEFGGVCHLRFDDTNPETEDMEYVESIMRDVRWLGFDWGEHLYFASDYYEQLYQYAEELILAGKAYVDDSSETEIREMRGTVMAPGTESPYRNRSVSENLDLFRRMRAGEFADGSKVLRAKGDMASPNMKMRDPLLYRIRHASHYRTGDAWCIYPMYDYAHPLSDAIEQITHSICTLEFENNRDIYDWLMDNLFEEPRPHQYEFARLNLDYTVMSKRKLLQLVEEGLVAGWDDPRLPTIAGLRRRGVTPSAIRAFAERIGVAKSNSRVEMSLLESCIRDDLNPVAPRVLAVLRPLKLVIINYPTDQVEWLDGAYFPHDVPKEGSRPIPFSRDLYIERTDFMEEPPQDFIRLAPGREVRLRHAYIVRCVDVVKDAAGEIVEIHCEYDPETRSGAAGVKKHKAQTAIQWVSAQHALPCEVRLYDRLLATPDPDAAGVDFKESLNPDSLEVLAAALIEPSVANDAPDTRYQFERHGYFWRDPMEAEAGRLIFNRIVGLRDSWEKQTQKQNIAPVKTASEARKTETPPALPRELDARARAQQRGAEALALFERIVARYGLPEDDAELLTRDPATLAFFEAAVRSHDNPRALAVWINRDIAAELKGRSLADLPFGPQQLAGLVQLIDEGVVSSAGAKVVFGELVANGGDPRAIVEAHGLRQVSDDAALSPIVERVVLANGDKAAQYRAGKTGLLGFFVGQVMKETRGAANPQLVQELVKAKLGDLVTA
jgi:glutaminyl-tRNA synthetase